MGEGSVLIIEQIITWFFSVLNYAVALLPANGDIFDNLPNLSYSFMKLITFMNGYIPIKEFGLMFASMLLVGIGIQAVRVVIGLYNLVSKALP